MSEIELLTIKQVAGMLACHAMTVRRKMEAGEFGPVIRQGRKYVRLRRSGVEGYIARNTK